MPIVFRLVMQNESYPTVPIVCSRLFQTLNSAVSHFCHKRKNGCIYLINETGLFLSNENTIGPAIGLLALVLREAARDRRSEIMVERQIELRDCRSTKCILRLKVCRSLFSPASQETGLNTKLKSDSLPAITLITSSCAHTRIL